MKKITLFIAVLSLVLTSCTTDIEVNTPGLQATINGELYRPETKSAILHEDGTLEIVGITGAEKISFTTTSTNKGSYKTSQQAVQKISFFDGESKFISEEQETIGEVVITEIYNDEITGNFYFKNLKNSNGKSITFQNGWFYRLPLINYRDTVAGTENNANPCLINASLTANVDGVEMISNNHNATPFGSQAPYNHILINASNNSQDIEIVFPIDASVGSHSLIGSADYSASYSINNDKSSAESGTLVITEHNQGSKCIKGTFEFTTRSGIVISEGDFDFGY